MTHHRMRLRVHLTRTTLDARAGASTYPCVLDLAGADVESSRTLSDAAVSWPHPIIDLTASLPPPPLATRCPLRLAFQSP
jgi:hypothetical protein